MRASTLLRRIRAYAENRDPLAAAGNRVALLVAANQPFYPIYVAWLVGNAWPTLLTFLSTPLFLAVPAVARRSPQAGRALLVLAGVANTMLAAKAVGVASGVEAFLAPCVVLAGLLFQPAERRMALALLAVCFAAFFGLHDRYGVPLHGYTTAQYGAFVRLNAVSAGGLLAFIGLTFSSLPGASDRRS